MTAPENPTAGQGPVVLDIGGDIGALIVLLPDDLIGREIEIVPAGTAQGHADGHPDHDHDHGNGNGRDHGHGGFHAGHHHPPGTPPHVAVVPRLMGSTLVASAVFGDLAHGRYDLSLRPGGPVTLSADVVGGEVATVTWPVG